jgi:nucleoside-diphosphate-sugar epimerase
MKILITGGAGFIGSNLTAHFTRAGHAVTVFDNFSRRGTEANLAWLQSTAAPAGVIRGDVRDAQAIVEAARGQDAIVHLAGQTTVTTSVTEPRRDFEDNAVGTFNTLEAARASDRQPIFIYTSTNKVYGGMEAAKVVEGPARYAFADMPNGVPETWPLDFHSPYGCCYSEETDVLTRTGWKRFYELSRDEDVLTYSMERGVAEFQRPTAHYAFPYQGKMYVQKNRRLQTCVTPNHRMLVAWDCNHDGLERPRLLEAQHIAGKPMAYLLGADVEGGKEADDFTLPAFAPGAKHKHRFAARAVPMADWLRFLGWYLAEGHCYRHAKTGNSTVTLTTYYRTDEAMTVMRAVGLSPVVDKHHVVATSRQHYEYLRQFGKAHAKYIPQCIKDLSKRHLVILLKALLDGDGNVTSKNSWRYTTVSEQLADDVQEIAIKCGYGASVRCDRQGFYRVYGSSTRTAQCNLDQDRTTWTDYSGTVYCVEVPNSVVLVRQNGYAYFSGNSKGAGDQYVRDYHRIYGLPTVVFRQSSIYGPRQFGIEDQGWIAFLAICVATGRPINIFGDGKQVRDILYVDDLARAFEAAVANIGRTAGQIYNMGGGPTRTLSIWTETGPMLEKLAGHPTPVSFHGWRPGDQRIYVSDISRAKADLGWEPRIGPEEGVRRLWEWVVENVKLFG